MAEGPNVGFATLQVIPSFKGASAALAGGVAAPATAAGAKAGGLFAGSMGTALKAAAPVALVAGVGAGLFKLGSEFQDAFKTIRVATGETGGALEGLEGSFKKVLATRPDSFDSVSTAIAKLNVGLGLTGAPLEELSTQVLRLSGITKTDLGTNLESVTTLFNAFGVKAGEQGGKLDELFRASQATGVSVAELASTMASGGSLLKTAGLDFGQSAALLGLLGKSGVSTTSVMAPLSKAIASAAKSGKTAGDVFAETFDAIRTAPDATSAAGAAIDVFGARAGPKLAGLIREGKLSYEELAATIASGSDTIASAGKDTSTLSGKFKVLKNAVAVALQPIATKLFDTLNSLAAKALPHVTAAVAVFGEAVSKGVAAIEPFFKTLTTGFTEDEGTPLEKFALTIRNTLLPALQKVGDFIKGNLKPILVALGVTLAAIIGPILVAIAGFFLGLISPVALVVGALVLLYTRFQVVRDVVAAVVDFFVGTVAPAVATFATFVADQFGALVAWVQLHWAAIQEAISHVVAVITEVISVAVAAISEVWHVWGDDLLRVAGAIFAQIQNVVTTAIDIIRGVIEVALALINGDWGKAWDGIKAIVATAWDFITGTIRNAIDGILGLIGGIGNTVASIAGGMFDGIKSAFVGAINFVIDAWNGLEFKIPGFDPPGPGPKFGGFTLGVPNIPRLHGGGLFRAPPGQSEGFALLSDREIVTTPSQSAGAFGGGDLIAQVLLDGRVVAESVYKNFRRRGRDDGEFLAGLA